MEKYIMKECATSVGLKSKAKIMICKICPRNCKVNRDSQLGFCKMAGLKVAKVMRHFWEEPIISGKNGSGAIFFSGCNLKCLFCQNYEISWQGNGKEISILELVDIFKKIEDANCENINLVSPTQFSTQIIEALKIYKPKIPVVWNSNGFEKTQTIKELKKYVDIFLADFKYFDSSISKEYSFAENYPKICKKALLQMRKNQPKDVVENGVMKKGLIIRHLILPNETKNSLDCTNWVNKHLGNKTYFSLMSQYTPCFKALKIKKLNRKIKPIEYKAVLNKVQNLKFENCFYQDFESATQDFIPNFSKFWEL